MQCTESDNCNPCKSNQKFILLSIKLAHIFLSVSDITSFKSPHLCNYACHNFLTVLDLLGGNRDTVVDPETLFVWCDCFKNIDKEKESVPEKDTKEKVKNYYV